MDLPFHTWRSSANRFMLKPSGFMKSSRRISPGWIGGKNFVAVRTCFSGRLCGLMNLDGELPAENAKRLFQLVQTRRVSEVEQAVHLGHVPAQASR